VYWFRRLMVLGVACALVFGVGRLLGASPAGEGPSARPASAGDVPARSSGPSGTATSDATGDAGPEREPGGRAQRKKAAGPRRTRTPLPMPTGPCRDSDVRVRPVAGQTAYAGRDVTFRLRLTTFESPACTWQVSPDSVAVRLTSGSDRIWTSQECRSAVPTVPVVVRQEKAAFVEVTWGGRRSDPECSRTTTWAVPGWYHVATAALGSEPVSRQFELMAPAPETITPKPTPKRKAREGARRDREEARREAEPGD
jgi:hypothetical protein